jgi:hypothetical protein
MPLVKYRANFLYAREELFALFACAQAGDVERGGCYDARGGEAMARKRKEERWAGLASRGM